MGKKRHSVDVLFMFVLFAVFAVLSVLIIYIGSGVYDRIAENKQANEQTRTTLSYIANKVRETGGGENVYIKETDGIPVLVLKSNIDGEPVETLIYEYDGRLMEMRVSEGDMFELQFGSTILKTGGIAFEIDDAKELLSVSVKEKGGSGNDISIYLGMGTR